MNFLQSILLLLQLFVTVRSSLRGSEGVRCPMFNCMSVCVNPCALFASILCVSSNDDCTNKSCLTLCMSSRYLCSIVNLKNTEDPLFGIGLERRKSATVNDASRWIALSAKSFKLRFLSFAIFFFDWLFLRGQPAKQFQRRESGSLRFRVATLSPLSFGLGGVHPPTRTCWLIIKDWDNTADVLTGATRAPSLSPSLFTSARFLSLRASVFVSPCALQALALSGSPWLCGSAWLFLALPAADTCGRWLMWRLISDTCGLISRARDI